MQEREDKKMQFFVPNLQSCLGPNFLHKLPGEFAMSTIRHELQRFNKKSRIGNRQHCCSHGKYLIFKTQIYSNTVRPHCTLSLCPGKT